jgi:signal transduction histidine kinase
MAIANRFVHRDGGTILAESNVDNGAGPYLTLEQTQSQGN